jgi:hypothetical protein
MRPSVTTFEAAGAASNLFTRRTMEEIVTVRLQVGIQDFPGDFFGGGPPVWKTGPPSLLSFA